MEEQNQEVAAEGLQDAQEGAPAQAPESELVPEEGKKSTWKVIAPVVLVVVVVALIIWLAI